MFIGKMFDKIRGGECLFVLGENRAGRCWRCWRCGGLRTVVLVWGGKEVDKNGRDGKRGNIFLGERGMVCIGKEFDKIRSGECGGCFW